MKKLLAAVLVLCSFHVQGQLNISLLGRIDYPGFTACSAWHHTDTLGNEYAVVGLNNMISIVDISDPANPAELFALPVFSASMYREVKAANGYAYVVSEGGGGVEILDLHYLPDSVPYHYYTGDGAISGQLNTAHTVAVQDGFLYLFGTNVSAAVFADLADPYHPVYAGQFTGNYIHDGYVRNDTLWAAMIANGVFAAIDITDKLNPQVITSFNTPGSQAHSCWLSDDSRYLFTAEEQPDGLTGSYDISDISNIELRAVYRTDSMPHAEVHNLHVYGNYLVCADYGSQLTVCDITRPGNLIETGNYNAGPGLVWDADPYLPSGNIIATVESGSLLILHADYTQACYLEGNVTDSVTGTGIPNCSINISGGITIASRLDGSYATGTASPGNYTVTYSKAGYRTRVISNTALQTGTVDSLDVQLQPLVVHAVVTDATNGNAVPNTLLSFTDAVGNTQYTTDNAGTSDITFLPPGTYDVNITAWGFRIICQQVLYDGQADLQFQLLRGYEDDFVSDLGWTVNSTATSGIWERGIPVGTTYFGTTANPDSDEVSDSGTYAYVTGNGGGTVNTDDVDDGFTTLTSPVFDLTSYSDPYISYSRWYYIQPGINAAAYDTLTVSLSEGAVTTTVDYAAPGSPSSQWMQHSFRVRDFMIPGPDMQLSVNISDQTATSNFLEAGFDRFYITEGPSGIPGASADEPNVKVYPNPYSGQCRVEMPAGVKGDVYADITDLSGRTVATEKLDQSGMLRSAAQLKPGIYVLRLTNSSMQLKPVRVVRR